MWHENTYGAYSERGNEIATFIDLITTKWTTARSQRVAFKLTRSNTKFTASECRKHRHKVIPNIMAQLINRSFLTQCFFWGKLKSSRTDRKVWFCWSSYSEFLIKVTSFWREPLVGGNVCVWKFQLREQSQHEFYFIGCFVVTYYIACRYTFWMGARVHIARLVIHFHYTKHWEFLPYNSMLMTFL